MQPSVIFFFQFWAVFEALGVLKVKKFCVLKVDLQGGLFNCPPPKISKYKKNLESSDCPPPKISKCQTGKENSD